MQTNWIKPVRARLRLRSRLRLLKGLFGEHWVRITRAAGINSAATAYSGDEATAYWRSVPAGNEEGGQIDSVQLLELSDSELLAFHCEHLERRRNVEWEKTIIAWLKPYVHHDSLVMDFGCGLGHSGWDVYTSLGGRIIFADIVPENLVYARKLIALHNADARTFLLPSKGDWQSPEPLDVVLALGVLHHIPHAKQVVSSIWRAMKPGGIIALLLYNHWHFRRRGAFTLAAYAGRSEALPGGPYSDFYDRKRTLDLMHGFRLLKSTELKQFGYDLYLFERT